MRLDFRFQHSGFRFRFDGFPFSERAALGGHAQFGPCRAPALATAAGGVQRGGVPLVTGSAGGFAGGEDFWRGGGESAACESSGCLAESGEGVFAKFNNVRREDHENVNEGAGFDPPKEIQFAEKSCPFTDTTISEQVAPS